MQPGGQRQRVPSVGPRRSPAGLAESRRFAKPHPAPPRIGHAVRLAAPRRFGCLVSASGSRVHRDFTVTLRDLP